MGEEELPLEDLSAHDLPEAPSARKELKPIVVAFRRADKTWDWHLEAVNGRILYGSSQGYENFDDMLHVIKMYHDDLGIRIH